MEARDNKGVNYFGPSIVDISNNLECCSLGMLKINKKIPIILDEEYSTLR